MSDEIESAKNEVVEQSIDDIIKDIDVKFFEKYEKVKSEAEQAVMYKKDEDLDIQIINCHSAAMRFTDRHAYEKHLYFRLKAKFERIYAEEVENAKRNPLMMRTTSELDGFVIRSNRIAKAKAILQNQLEMVEYLQSVLDLLKSKRFDLKTIADIKKSENGR